VEKTEAVPEDKIMCSPISLSKPKRKHKPTPEYESFQKQQMSNKRLKKQTEKTKEKSRRDNSESDFENTVSPEKMKLDDKVEPPVIPALVSVNSEKLVDSCKSE